VHDYAQSPTALCRRREPFAEHFSGNVIVLQAQAAGLNELGRHAGPG
jgi:hypothetical protein